MGAAIYYWRVWCETDLKSEYVWSKTAPTVCPVNGGHAITLANTAIVGGRLAVVLNDSPTLAPIEPNATSVVANGRPAIETQPAADGYAATSAVWSRPINAAALLTITAKFILEASGTGTVVRLAAKAKAESVGDDSSEAFTLTGFDDVTVTHATLGEVFEGTIELDASSFNEDDALAIQIGRAGADAADTCDVAVQIISVKIEAT